MAPGFFGADIAQLCTLSKSLGQSGNRLKTVESTVNLFEFVESTVDEAAALTAAASEGIVTSRRYRGDADPVVANLKVQRDGTFQLAAAPLDDQGQLSVRDLASSERPGLVVRELLSVTR